MAFLKFRGVRKRFGDKVVLDGLDLEIRRGETLVIIGQSGCGKSVTLKCLLGLIRPDEGTIMVDGADIGAMDEEALIRLRARFGMVFQFAALFDSLDVDGNVGFALRRMGRPEDEVRRIVAERLAAVGLPGTEKLKPSELSGGMRKRVGLARALAGDPEVLLYDEPTTGLDPIMADAISGLIVATRERTGVTSVVVTHDMTSAYKVGHRIALLYRGRIRALGTPDEIRGSADPVVQQFIHGRADGPIDPVGARA
jgi:phospholipid/cholesterol/gamma-HCH transport system ATP-binding protein